MEHDELELYAEELNAEAESNMNYSSTVATAFCAGSFSSVGSCGSSFSTSSSFSTAG